MESNSFFPSSDDFKNNKIKECPFCNALLPLSEYDDHLFCHTIDQQENGQNLNINNYGIDQQQNNINGPSQITLNNKINNLNNNYNNNNSINNNNNNNLINNNNNFDNNFSIFEENNINENQNYINPQLQNLNSINFINENNNQNNINNINNNNQNNINNNINNNNQNFINNNQNFINNIENNNNNSESAFDKFNISYFFSNLPNPFQNSQNKDQKKDDKDNNQIAPENLSEEERERRNKLEEQRLYEKKILGIIHDESEIKVEDKRSMGQKVKDYFGNNPDNILAVVDVIGCLVLNGPSIGRTILRVGRFVGNNIMSIGSGGNEDANANENINSEEYQNMIRNHPELKKKNKDMETIIKFLPVSVVKEIKENENNDDRNNNRKCVICLCDFEVGEEVTALPCLHVFHTECIASWIKAHCHCPICKFDVTLQSLIGGH